MMIATLIVDHHHLYMIERNIIINSIDLFMLSMAITKKRHFLYGLLFFERKFIKQINTNDMTLIAFSLAEI